LMANKKMMPFLNEQKVRKIKGVWYGSKFKMNVMKLTCLFAF
jgi:hypothetical protein